MDRKLRSKASQAIYALRKTIVDLPGGVILATLHSESQHLIVAVSTSNCLKLVGSYGSRLRAVGP
jgi:hypothetical protein